MGEGYECNFVPALESTLHNKIYNKDCITGLRHLPDNCIDLIVTSPPYKDEDGYSKKLIRDLSLQCYGVSKPDTLCFVNFGHLAENKRRPFEVARLFELAGYEFVDTIVWVKTQHTPIRGKKRLNNLTEFIFMFAKGDNYELDRLSIGVPYVDKSNIGRYSDIDLRCGGNVWTIPYETIQSKAQKLHKDRFPVELPRRCIKLANLSDGAVVLDPFMGSGTTAVACKELGKSYFGFEINKKYYDIALKRLEEVE